MGQISSCWEVFAEHHTQDKAVELQVTSYNRGGLLVNWDDVTGFVPASQLCSSIPYDDEEHRRDALAQLVGMTLELKIIELDPTEGRLILSERATNRIEEPNLGLLDELTPGDIRHGRVTNLCAFGAFVDLGGLEGLIHISELSWGRVAHPSDVLESGQEVDVYVLKVDREQSRVGLSLKRLKPDPWNTVEDRYQIGQIVEGLVTNVVKFGAFVRIEDGLEGLIHASEFPGDVGIPSHYVQEGDAVQVRIMSIEGSRHRIGLSLL
jgi:small subunit ribosomal protein S1